MSSLDEVQSRLKRDGAAAYIASLFNEQRDHEHRRAFRGSGRRASQRQTAAFLRVILRSHPNITLELHLQPQPIARYDSDTQFIVLGGEVECVQFQEERYPPRTQATTQFTMQPQKLVRHQGTLLLAHQFVVSFADEYKPCSKIGQTFWKLVLNTRHALLLVDRAKEANPTSYWTEAPDCYERGVPKPRLSVGSQEKGIRDSLRQRLLDLLGPQENLKQRQLIHRNAFIGGVIVLRETVKRRQPPTLASEDRTICEQIAASLKEYVAYGGRIDELAALLPDAKPKFTVLQEWNCTPTIEHAEAKKDLVLNRFLLFDDEQWLALKLHHFANATETFRHTHSTSVVSVALRGTYTHSCHTLIDMKPGDEPTKLWTRSLSSEHREGIVVKKVLQPTTTFDFHEGSSYFLDKHAFHTVQAKSDEHGVPRPVVTLFFKDRFKPLNSEPEFADLNDVVPQELEVVDAETKAALLHNAHELLGIGDPSANKWLHMKASAYDTVVATEMGCVPNPKTALSNFETWAKGPHNTQLFEQVSKDLRKLLQGLERQSSLEAEGDCELEWWVVGSKPATFEFSEAVVNVTTRHGVTIVQFVRQALPVSVHFCECDSALEARLRLRQATDTEPAKQAMRALRRLRSLCKDLLPPTPVVLEWACARTAAEEPPRTWIQVVEATLRLLLELKTDSALADTTLELLCTSKDELKMAQDWARVILRTVFA
jgi:hypothetical protein